MKIVEVLAQENWRITRVETEEYTFYIHEALLVQAFVHPVTGAGFATHWYHTAIHAAARPEAVNRIVAAQGVAQAEIARKVQEALHPCDECGGKPTFTECFKCGRKP